MKRIIGILCSVFLVAVSSLAQAQLVDKKALTLAEARKAVAAASAEAKANGWNVV